MTEKLSFDQLGYLQPYDIVSADWNTFVEQFGESFQRQEILTRYKSFLDRLRDIVPFRHRHWIDGSFVSKKMQPNDIDVIIFVPHVCFATASGKLKELKEQFRECIDCYFVEVFPPDHNRYEIGRADELDWYHFLHTDRLKRPKGILELWFDYGNQ
ncbi:DUF6932 family protein [Spirosoma sp. KUDC1026]|uniref:DUF6932 family protein n=1 Tax=Spirosoma sp. KUDC1026 TaxID=2745947 RepID=UPI00159BAB9B|nr:hypothetical protein [Spirosoma sp. KUDC1026]QKZ13025.1 hypothetical protein HU175_10430 [Spirosoma sp. KUDC1026]